MTDYASLVGGLREPTPAASILRVASAHDLAGPELPARVMVTPLGRVQYQSSAGSCVAHGFSKVLENEALRRGVVAQVSRHFLYYVARLMRGWQNEDKGTTLGDMAAAIEKYGAPSEQSRPYDARTVNTPPSADLYAEAHANRGAALRFLPARSITAIKSSLARGLCVPFGFMVTRAYMEATQHDGLARFDGGDLGGHCQHFVGYDDAKEAFLAENSWPNFGVAHPDGGTVRAYQWFTYGSVASGGIWESVEIVTGLPVEA